MSGIAALEAIPFRIPLREPIAWRSGLLETDEHVLVRITDHDGVVGIAEAIPRPTIHGETIGSVLSACELARKIVEERAVWERERIWEELDAALVGNHTAKAAIDMAVADLCCRRLNVSCHQLFGGFTDTIRVSHSLGLDEPAKVAAEAARCRTDYGITAFRLKVGRPKLKDDVDAIRRIREDQPDALVYADANHVFDQLEALRFARAVTDLDVAWFEEPVAAEQVVARQRIARESGLSIYGDESCTTPFEVGREILAGRTHVICLKLARIGYVAGERLRGFCETVGAPMVMGTQGDSGIGVLTGMAFGAAHASTSRYPAEYGYIIRLEDDLLAEPLEIKDGELRVRLGAGNSVTIDEDKLKHYRVD